MKAKAVPFELVSPNRKAQRVDHSCPCPNDFACMECEEGAKCAVLSCKTRKMLEAFAGKDPFATLALSLAMLLASHDSLTLHTCHGYSGLHCLDIGGPEK